MGFDLARFEENQVSKRADFRKRYNLDDDEIAIGIIGRIVPVKNHEFFLTVLKHISQKTSKKIRAFIIGDGEGREKVEQTATELGLKFNTGNTREKDILTFTSWIKEIDVSNAGLDIIVLTSNNEGTPVSLIEAQASGKPVISTNVGGIENIVIQNETALLSPVGDLALFKMIFLEKKCRKTGLILFAINSAINGFAVIWETYTIHFYKTIGGIKV